MLYDKTYYTNMCISKPDGEDWTEEKFNDQVISHLKEVRTKELELSDKLVQEDFPLPDDVKAQLKVYRQALRDLPDNYPSTFTTVDDANPGEIDTSSFWPEHPDIS